MAAGESVSPDGGVFFLAMASPLLDVVTVAKSSDTFKHLFDVSHDFVGLPW